MPVAQSRPDALYVWSIKTAISNTQATINSNKLYIKTMHENEHVDIIYKINNLSGINKHTSSSKTRTALNIKSTYVNCHAANFVLYCCYK